MKNGILQAAFNLYGFKAGERTRKRERVNIRQVLAYLLTTQAGMTFDAAGKVLGGFDHSTIVFSRNQVMARIDIKDPTTMTVIREIQRELNPRTVWIGEGLMSVDFNETLIG